MNRLSFDLEKLHREELLRQAAQDRLVNLAKANRPQLVGPALVKLGDWMIIMGTRLQTHYGQIIATPDAPISTQTFETGA